MKRLIAALAVAGGLSLSAAPRAQATVIITGEETGGNVVFSYSGTIDLTGMTFYAGVNYGSIVSPSFAFLSNGPVASFSGPGSIVGSSPDLGPGGSSPTGTRTGQGFVISAANQFGFIGEVGVPFSALPFSPFSVANPSYGVTGLIEGALSIANTTFLGLGLDTPLDFTWTLANGDTVVLRGIGTAEVPEPGTLSLLALALGGGVALRRRGASRRDRNTGSERAAPIAPAIPAVPDIPE